MTTRILIMGLPGAGKTTLAQCLEAELKLKNKTTLWLNADTIRQQYNDWDFSHAGRIRQSQRMRDLSNNITYDFVICDFVAPLEEMRVIFNADYTIWVDTISKSCFENTNAVFSVPSKYDIRITEKNASKWCDIILQDLVPHE